MSDDPAGHRRFRKIGFITGLREEAEAFRPGEGELDRHCPYYCREGEDFVIACGGIGKVHAATAATSLIDRQSDLLVSLGVAGRLDEGPLGAHWITGAIQHDYGAHRGGGFVRYSAGTMPIGDRALEGFRAIANPGLDLPSARILTGDAFLEDAAEGAALGEALGGDLIDMETGAIAQVATLHGLPWAGIRSVSDTADAGSASDFQQNLARAAREAAVAAERLMELLALPLANRARLTKKDA